MKTALTGVVVLTSCFLGQACAVEPAPVAEKGQVVADQQPAGTTVPFDAYDGYFVSNKFEPDAAESYVFLHDQKAFDQVFGTGFVMNDKRHRLAKDAFETKAVVALAKRGKAIWTYKVQAVTVDGGVLTINYTATSQAQKDAEFASPLILSVPKGSYASVQFVENGKVVKTIEQKPL